MRVRELAKIQQRNTGGYRLIRVGQTNETFLSARVN
jgi:hypothetical protein